MFPESSPSALKWLKCKPQVGGLQHPHTPAVSVNARLGSLSVLRTDFTHTNYIFMETCHQKT